MPEEVARSCDRPMEIGGDNSCRATPFNAAELLQDFSKLVRANTDIRADTRTESGSCQSLTDSPTQPREGDIKLDDATRSSVIQTLVQNLKANYVFPDVADQISNSLLSRSFGDISSGIDFAKALTDQLRSSGMDKHLDVSFNPTQSDSTSEQENLDESLKAQRLENSGVARAELFGNTGILKLDSFWPTSDPNNPEGARMAREAIDAAMAKLAGADNLIIDLRENTGGDPATVAHALSHLLPADTHINSIIWRNPSPQHPDAVENPRLGGFEQQFKTHDVGNSLQNVKNIYVLTSCNTFSGGEEMAYDLQALGRATIIGDVTGGGANPGEGVKLSPNFSAFIPTGRAYNPITQTNWEGVGVKPDVQVTSDQALIRALELIHRK
mgnify:CR=1 FL=1